MNESPFWTAERIALVKERWEEGATCSAIAAEVGEGCTKNQIIGKARRLDLPMRFQPKEKPKPRDPFDGLGGSDCRWPIGNPGDADFHFCGGSALPEKPYCDRHCAKAYIKPQRAQQMIEQGGRGWTEERRVKQGAQASARLRARNLAAAK